MLSPAFLAKKAKFRNAMAIGALSALLLMSGIALADLIAQPASAAFPGTNGLIAFANQHLGGIYVMNDDGTAQIRLTNNFDDVEPRWSPDGAKIAFSRNEQIYVMNADGSDQKNLSNNRDLIDRDPSWSPDGKKIAFTRNAQIYVMNADGSDQKKLMESDGGSGYSPIWSPDGSKIAFRVFGANFPIYVVNSDGTDSTLVTGTPVPVASVEFIHHTMDWSPDSKKLVYSQDAKNIYTINVDGTEPTNLMAESNISSSAALSPSWSPDGTKIVYVNESPEGPWVRQIVIMNADGTEKTVMPSLSIAHPDWGVAPRIEPATITVNSVETDGDTLNGMWTTVRLASDGTLMATGYTPFSFTGIAGTEYKVSVADYAGITFAKWQDDDSASRGRIVDLTSDTRLTAMYDSGDSLRGYSPLTYPGGEGRPSLTINVINAGGGSPLLMWTIIDPQSTDESGTTYKVYLHNYAIGTFWYWEDGSEDMVRTVTITEDTTLNVYYLAPWKF